MPNQSWVQVFAYAQSDGSALTGTTPTSILPAAAKNTLSPCSLMIGSLLRLKASGRISNIVTTPGTFTFDLKFGSTIVWTSGAIPLNIVAKTNVTWILEVDLVVRAIGGGTNANLMGIGRFQSESVIGSPAASAGGNGSLVLPTSAPAVGNGFDSTAQQVPDLFGTFSVNNAGNAITLHQFSMLGMN